MSTKVVKKKLTDLPTYAGTTNAGYCHYREGTVDYKFPMSDVAMLSALSADGGQALIGAPKTIDALRGIARPSVGVEVTTLGAFSEGDGGGGLWVYDTSNLSAQVSSYPRLFIPPSSDPTGASGAWKLKPVGDISAAALGFGIKGLDSTAGTTWAAQAAVAAQTNKEILEQLVKWNAGRAKIIIPPAIIYSSYYDFGAVNPKLYGTPATSSQQGSFFMTHEDLSTAPLFSIGSLTTRMNGCNIENISAASWKFFGTANYDTFTDARDNRIAFKFVHVGTRTAIRGLYAGGFAQAYYLSEAWDGVMEECRALYCSTPDGTTPAIFIGTNESDNTNAMEIRRLHIEFSPYTAEIGFCEHVNFVDCKFEAYRKANATHRFFTIQPQSSKINIKGTQFVTNNASTVHAVYDCGQFTTFEGCWFAGADSADYPQAGIHWYARVNSTNSRTVFRDCHFNRCHMADGTNPNDYSLLLGNYTVFSAICRASDTYNTSSGTVTVASSGLLNIGTSCTVEQLHYVVGAGTRTGGALLYFSGTGSRVERITGTASNTVWRLAAGDANNSIGIWGNQYQNASTGVVYTYGKKDVLVTATTALTQLYGMVGDIISITPQSGATGSTVTNSSNLVTLAGTDLTMTVKKTYLFRMETGSIARQIV